MPELQIDDLRVEIIRKNIRTLRLTVYAHGGRSPAYLRCRHQGDGSGPPRLD
ncbi:hypothetical protein HMJ29_12960 [Hymenobacter taeanensis]|uniref:Uncharacterized protein n=1 Tax=Hymenobacter taeanensis TaxID=2735321 RepID=A0A6M6BIH6_9BACT|nr:MULTISPECIES: hypothetical protein [Hymenobacter]QJX47802.1 hypothetical protein HMJ29_12960 [Hymenobacter taeanensis]UOQ82710.1 hypothetical protein MUN83_08105 [Hymenobacter sp. 5414T-23]